MRGMTRRNALGLIGGGVLAVVSATWPGTARAQSATPTLVDLGNVSTLREQFNKDHGTIRLVLLLSPT
jgi:hypothetical protein